jgi:hypothetical protein
MYLSTALNCHWPVSVCCLCSFSESATFGVRTTEESGVLVRCEHDLSTGKCDMSKERSAFLTGEYLLTSEMLVTLHNSVPGLLDCEAGIKRSV